MWSVFNIANDPDTTGDQTHSAIWTDADGATLPFSLRCPPTDEGLTTFKAAANEALELWKRDAAQKKIAATVALKVLNTPQAGES